MKERLKAAEIEPDSSLRAQKAMELFHQGYNCSQSVVLAYADLLQIDEKTLASLASSFGGGMGRLREVCGVCSGMFMVAGLLYGYEDPTDQDGKKAHYERIQELAGVFRDMNGSIVCRELLGLSIRHDDPTPAARTEEYYKKRPCGQLAGVGAAILEAYIKRNEIKCGL